MPTTVHFATNRLLTGPADTPASYGDDIVTPSSPTEVTYGTAFVQDAGLTADTVGAITSIQNTTQGGFSQSAIDDLSDPGRNLLIFIHGFDNSFENAITRAAFNQQWLAASGVPAAETSVVAFSWPSLGRLLAFPLPLQPYWSDQTAAGQSGLHISAFFANLPDSPAAAREQAQKPSWTPKSVPMARPDWLSALDGMWPAMEAKLGAKIAAAQPAASETDVRKAT